MKSRFTHEEFVLEAKQCNPNIKIIGKYKSLKTKVNCKCIKHNLIWDGNPTAILRGCGCKLCKSEKISSALSLSNQEFISRISNSIQPLETYKNNTTKILCKCKSCGHEWKVLPSNLLKGSGCIVCTNHYKDNEIFLSQLSEILPYIIPKENYNGSYEKIKCSCLKCGNDFVKAPNKLFAGQGCPFCEKSKGEMKINSFLQYNHIDFDTQKRFYDLRGVKNGQLSYDFYLPDYNLLIEYQGNFHDGTADIQTEEGFIIQQEHDKRKREYAKDHNIDLLEIWYYDIDNIEQILMNKLHINNIKKPA